MLWQVDLYAASFDDTKVSRDLHRFAGMNRLSCSPKRSAIDRRYFAEITQHVGNGEVRFNVAMGTGDTPLHAALEGYAAAAPHLSAVWAVYRLEIEALMLSRAAARSKKAFTQLEGAVDQLIAALAKL